MFSDCIQKVVIVPDIKLLPVIHSTPSLLFEQILENREIRLQICTGHDKELAFFFYGRHAYRVDDDAELGERGVAPCVLIFDSDGLQGIEGVFPFDTGSFEAYQKGPISRHAKLADFHCGRDVLTCEAIVQNYWKSRGDYMLFDTEKGLHECECKGDNQLCGMYQELLRGIRSGNLDDRRGTIEICISRPLNFVARHLQGLVIPSSALGISSLRELLEETSRESRHIQLSVYRYRLRPREHFGEIEQRTRSLLSFMRGAHEQ